MRGAGRWSLATACHGQRSRQGRGSWPQEGSRHIRRVEADRSTGRGYLRKSNGAAVSEVNHAVLLSATDLDWCLKLKEDGLRDENLTRLGAQVANLSLKKLDLLAGPAAPDL